MLRMRCFFCLRRWWLPRTYPVLGSTHLLLSCGATLMSPLLPFHPHAQASIASAPILSCHAYAKRRSWALARLFSTTTVKVKYAQPISTAATKPGWLYVHFLLRYRVWVLIISQVHHSCIILQSSRCRRDTHSLPRTLHLLHWWGSKFE